jgi:CHAT domain-containing protein
MKFSIDFNLESFSVQQTQSKKRNDTKFAAFIVVCLGLTACQSTAPSMSLDEARKIAADFKISNFVAPPRTIDILKANFKDGKTVPKSCVNTWAAQRKTVAQTLDRLEKATTDGAAASNAAYMVVLAEDTMTTGRFDDAVSYIETALDKLNHMNNVRQAVAATQLSRLHARLGDLSSANTYMRRSLGYWTSGSTDWLRTPKGRLYTNSGYATLAWLRGELPLAEYHFRKVVETTKFGGGGSYDHINVNELRANLARVLMQQGRKLEAEAVARDAIEKLRISSPYSSNYIGTTADPVAVLAMILLEQGKVEDAEYLARVALNMHESSCSEPQSLGITEVRLIWINALAEQANWSGILEQVGKARKSLKDYPDLFNRQFGSSLAYIEAELNAGDVDRGKSIAERLMIKALAEDGPDSYRVAEIEGILGLTETQMKQNQFALKRFAKAMPILVAGHNNSGIAVNGRRERILHAYMDLLVNLAAEGSSQVAGLDVPGELLRVSSARRLGRVQQAVAAGAVRAAAGNRELSKLVRQEQDLTEEAQALGEALAYVQFAPSATSSATSSDELKKRLSAVDLARRTLRIEILERFPNYAELIAPKPMTVAEIGQKLTPGQALLTFHVGENSTYVWAMPHGGKLAFSKIDISRRELNEKVMRLRLAVDPGTLRTLDDIPDFDVVLAHELYTSLLKPVAKSWQGASELLLVADGPLGALPFSMLATSPKVMQSDNNGALFARYQNVSWLAKSVAVTALPSVNALKSSSNALKNSSVKKTEENPEENSKETPNKIPGRRPFVGFGDPFFSAQQALGATTTEVASRGFSLRAAPETRSVTSADLALLPRLPDTRDEILSIANAVGADLKRDLFLGKDASEHAVKSTDLSSYNVISFATHGLVPGDLNGLDEPALALSSPDVTKNKEDGLLTMNEILGLKLNAEFAVLSACNTAAADGAGAEAVSGLGRAFFYAGAKALLVSNWPVNSGSTTDLMSRMFKSLATDKTLSRSEALRQTKLYQIMKGGYMQDGKLAFSYAHPIFWAPFTIVGDGGGTKFGS